MSEAPPNIPERGDRVEQRGNPGRLGSLVKYDLVTNRATVKWDDDGGPTTCDRFDLEKVFEKESRPKATVTITLDDGTTQTMTGNLISVAPVVDPPKVHLIDGTLCREGVPDTRVAQVILDVTEAKTSMTTLPPTFPEDLSTPAGFRAGRLALGLTRKQLSRVLGVRFETLEKWENDKPDSLGPNPVAVRAMEWMLIDGYRPPEFPTGGGAK